jgi:hypothetical protein
VVFDDGPRGFRGNFHLLWMYCPRFENGMPFLEEKQRGVHGCVGEVNSVLYMHFALHA